MIELGDNGWDYEKFAIANFPEGKNFSATFRGKNFE